MCSRSRIAIKNRSVENNESEKFVLGCCFIDGVETVAKCVEVGLSAEDFRDPRNRIIYQKILDLSGGGLVPDVAILADQLGSLGQLESAGGIAHLIEVSSCIPTTAQAEYFINRVMGAARLRAIVRATQSIAERAATTAEEIDVFIDTAEKEFFEATHRKTGNAPQTAKVPTQEAMKLVQRMLEKNGALTGIPSGLLDLDAITRGFQRQEMIILAARPSMGKTTLALNFADAAAMPKKGTPAPVLFFSLEMSAAQLVFRMMCARARVSMKLLADGLLSRSGEDQARLVAAADDLSHSPLLIDDSSALSVMQLRSKARRAHTRQKLGLIIVDYLQLMSPSDSRAPREQQVAEASRGLKALAKELNVPVLVLSQLNRASEKENRTPRLADLRESGSIEQDADVVLMLARPRDADDRFQVAADVAELIVAKQRNGPVGELKITFLRDIARFENFVWPG